MIVVGKPKRDVGITNMHDLTGQLTTSFVHTSFLTHTISILSAPGSGTHTLISVIKPCWLLSCGILVLSIPLAMLIVVTVNKL